MEEWSRMMKSFGVTISIEVGAESTRVIGTKVGGMAGLTHQLAEEPCFIGWYRVKTPGGLLPLTMPFPGKTGNFGHVPLFFPDDQ